MKIKEKHIKNTKWESTPRGVKVVMAMQDCRSGAGYWDDADSAEAPHR